MLVLNVPHHPEPEGFCGPSALTSVLNYWRSDISVDEVTRAVYLPQLKGTLGIDLARFAREKGMRAEMMTGSLLELKANLSRGIPPIAFINLGVRLFPVGHFVVVTGIDEARQEVIVHSGPEANQQIPYRVFLAAWEKTGFWMLQVVPSLSGGR